MATTFHILEEDGIENKGRAKLGEKITRARRHGNASRNALQQVNGSVSQVTKRQKIETCDYYEDVVVDSDVEEVLVDETTNLDDTDNVDVCSVESASESREKCEKQVSFYDDLEFHEEYLRVSNCYFTRHLVILGQHGEECHVATPTYMKKQLHLNNGMRSLLIDWLATVAEEYNLSEQTLHLSVNYIDRFLSQMAVVKSKLQLLGCAAMLVAGKIEDIYPPDSKEWAYLSNNTYSSQQIKKMEQLLLKILKFELQPPTMLVFIQHLCTELSLDKETLYLAMYFSELILLEGEDYLHYQPSKLAAASVALARCTLAKRKTWPKKLAMASGYTLKQLSPVVQRQNRTFIDSPNKPQQAIQAKYQKDEYCKVALLKPKILELDEPDDN